VKTGDPVLIRTDPFVLENLIWLCIECGLDAELPEKTLTMTVESCGDGARIRFQGAHGMHDQEGVGSPFQMLTACAEKAGAEITCDEGAGEIALSMPLDACAG
jgi:hypothetical protein